MFNTHARQEVPDMSLVGEPLTNESMDGAPSLGVQQCNSSAHCRMANLIDAVLMARLDWAGAGQSMRIMDDMMVAFPGATRHGFYTCTNLSRARIFIERSV